MSNPSVPSVLLPSIKRFLREARRARKTATLTPAEQKLRRSMARAFRAQGAAFLRRWHPVREADPAPDDASVPADVRGWEAALADAQEETYSDFVGPLAEDIAAALASGAAQALGEMSLDVAFDLSNPRAVAYLRNNAADLVTGINSTTRDQLRTVIADGVERGASYGEIAREISGRFDDFASARAELIATTEMGNAYAEGNMIIGRDLRDAGLTMEKSWLTAGDDRVDPVCDQNEGDGWIPIDESFSSGDDRPTAHSGCRCDVELQMSDGSPATGEE